MAESTQVHEVALPAGAEAPIRVYVNGEERSEGDAFVVDGQTLRFTPPLRAQPALSLGRKVLLGIGIGVYGDLRGDTLDVHYQAAGRPQTVTIPLTPEGEGGSWRG
jgi:hypothetical protein